MKTWAYLMALHDKAGLDINYIFESDDEEYRGEAIRYLTAMVGTETLKQRINRPHSDPRALTVSIVKLEALKNMESIEKNVFPVAMSDGADDANIPLRDFSSALAIGLAQAGCAKVKIETPGEFDEAVSGAYQKMLSIYKRLLNMQEDEFTPETLKDIIESPAIRLNHAIALALPPIVRLAFEYLKDYHERLHLLLESA